MGAVRPPRGFPTKREFFLFSTIRFISRSHYYRWAPRHPWSTLSALPTGRACSSPLPPWDASATVVLSRPATSVAVPPAPAPTAFAATLVSPPRTYPWPVSPLQTVG